MMNRNHLVWIVGLLVALLSCARAAGQQYTTIDLRPGAEGRVGRAVVLSDIAVVAGPDADRLATVVVLEPHEPGDVEVSRDQVRKALDGAGAMWGRTLLRGRVVALRVGAASSVAAAPAVVTAPEAVSQVAGGAGAGSAARLATAAAGDRGAGGRPGTVGMLLVDHIAERCGVEPADVRLSTESSAPADAELLSSAVDTLLAYRVVVSGSSVAGRTQVKIEGYGADRVALNRTVTVDVLVRKAVTVATVPLPRLAVIGAGDVKIESQWLPYSQASRVVAADPERLIGSSVKRRVDVGRVVTVEDVAAQLVVKRGEEVTVSIVAGGIMLRSKGRALGSARDNERVQIEMLDGGPERGEKRGGRVVTARMSGRGQAVVSAAE